ncbi:immunity protein Imm33 domain-containing protein [Aeromicrobium sp.]|uniref:immunity protein Imm33 domain-containing protein n=1 Tax=Aeromicrobium sp. TaxID=1871063 RepID=UPI003C4DD601
MTDYRIADGEARHAEEPRSFFIPSRSEREGLQPGDYAKLLFELVQPEPGDPGAERMWVEVLGVQDGRFVGALANVPSAISAISVGGRVDFGPENVIGTRVNWPLLETKILVSRRSHVEDVRPAHVYREDPDGESDSGWRAMVGDEADEEIGDAANLLLQSLGYLLDRWPELRPVFKTDPENGEWRWNAERESYMREPLAD